MSDKTIEISERRLERFHQVSSQRQIDLTVVLENVHDPHNIGAVLRSCDSVGISEVYIVDTDPRLQDRRLQNHGSSTGTNKWVQINYFTDIDACMASIKSKYDFIIGTVLEVDSVSLYDLDYTLSTAFVFGNEKDGISEELSKYLTKNMLIPQMGFARSLNISVACAVSIYEALRQRKAANLYHPVNRPKIMERFIALDQEKRLARLKK